jgi:hypothetical protein
MIQKRTIQSNKHVITCNTNCEHCAHALQGIKLSINTTFKLIHLHTIALFPDLKNHSNDAAKTKFNSVIFYYRI